MIWMINILVLLLIFWFMSLFAGSEETTETIGKILMAFIILFLGVMMIMSK